MPEVTENWQRDALPRGTMLHGYRIDRIMGRGGFGITYRAVDAIDQLFAMKECFPRQFACRDGVAVQPVGSDDEGPFRDCLTRFLREAKALVRLSASGAASEGIVRVVTLFEANGTAYLVMELLTGQTLQDLLSTHPTGVEPAELRSLMQGVLRALAVVHGIGLLHRDIKPGNIFLRANGVPVLIDFGAVRASSMSGQTVTFTQIYSESYAPVEQIVGEAQKPSADLYAFGASFYRMIGGTLTDALTRHQSVLAGGTDPLVPAVVLGAGRYQPSLLQAIDACLRPAAEDRPQSVAAAMALLNDEEAATVVVLSPRAAVPPPPQPTVPQVVKPKTARRARLPLAAGLGLGLLCAATGVWFATDRSKPPKDAVQFERTSTAIPRVGEAGNVAQPNTATDGEEAKRKAAAADDEAKRQAADEEAKRQAADDEAKRQAVDDEAKRQAVDDEAKRQAAEADAKRRAAAEADAKRRAAAADAEARRRAAIGDDVSHRAMMGVGLGGLPLLAVPGLPVEMQPRPQAKPKSAGAIVTDAARATSSQGGRADPHCHDLAEKFSLGWGLSPEDSQYQSSHCH